MAKQIEESRREVFGRRGQRWDRHAFYGLSEPEIVAAKARSRRTAGEHLTNYKASLDVQVHRCMTLPGARWTFERAFSGEFGWSPIWIGLEASPSVVEYSVRYMPSRFRREFFCTTPRGEFRGYNSGPSNHRAASLVNADLRSLVSTCSELGDVEPDERARDRVLRQLCRWTMFWLDGFSTLTTVLQDLAGVEACFHPWVTVVPFAVTVFVGHEPPGPINNLIKLAPGDAAESRAAVLAEVLCAGRDVEIAGVERYGHMALITGEIRLPDNSSQAVA